MHRNNFMYLYVFTSLAKQSWLAFPHRYTWHFRPPPPLHLLLLSSSKNAEERSKGRRAPGINISELCESLLSGSRPSLTEGIFRTQGPADGRAQSTRQALSSAAARTVRVACVFVCVCCVSCVCVCVSGRLGQLPRGLLCWANLLFEWSGSCEWQRKV